MTITGRLRSGSALAHGVDPRCGRCGAEAELGVCEFCGRDLCVECYDGDQEFTGGQQRCRFNGGRRRQQVRDQEIAALRQQGKSVDDIAACYGLSRRSVFRVLVEVA